MFLKQTLYSYLQSMEVETLEARFYLNFSESKCHSFLCKELPFTRF